MAVRAVAPRVHAVDSSRELVLHAVVPPSSWIRFPPFFAFKMPPRGPLELWLQHADVVPRRSERRLKSSLRARST